jgi:hypothetical protein
MKKLMLITSLCVAAFVVAPVASASADEGVCAFKGVAKFGHALAVTGKNKNSYQFTGSGECFNETTKTKETATGVSVNGTGTSEGELGCNEAEAGFGLTTGEPAPGELTLSGKGKRNFKLKIRARVAGLVELFASGEVEASFPMAAATFLTSAQAAKCPKGEATELEFEAAAKGKI